MILKPSRECVDCGELFEYHPSTRPTPQRCKSCRATHAKVAMATMTTPAAMVRYAYVTQGTAKPLEGCRHHWLIEPPNGGSSVAGTCKHCGETREWVTWLGPSVEVGG